MSEHPDVELEQDQQPGEPAETGPPPEVDQRFAVVDEDGLALNVIVATPEAVAELTELGAFDGAAGVREVTHADPQPGPGWRYERTTRTWTPPTEEQQ